MAYNKEIDEWKAKRLARLTRDDGWLTLCGLSWLKEGKNSVGSDSTNTVILPAGKAPNVVGAIYLAKGVLQFEAQKGVEVYHNDSLVTSLPIVSDEQSDPTILRYKTITFYVIKRGEELCVRVKDKENPERLHFKGLEYFPVNPKFRFEAKLIPYNPAKILEIPSAIGTVEKNTSPGALAFQFEGKEYRIDAVIEKGSEDQFFIMMMDETSGKETYAVGRQLYTSLPDSNGNVILDFNRAYNWPCVFTPYATCPIPPKQKDRKSTRLNSSHSRASRMPSSA